MFCLKYNFAVQSFHTSMTPLEEIKSRISVEQLIADYIPLNQAGTNFKGLCPFHQEKTPSFMVSPEKQIWHCFGCSEGGDIFSFVQKYDGIEFKEAAQLLAQKAGVVLTGFRGDGVDQGTKRKLFEINEQALAYYKQELQGKTLAAQKTRSYLESRGLSPDTIATWSLGLSPDSWDTVTQALKQKFPIRDLTVAGISIVRDSKEYDRFRKRLMFPIGDPQGRIIAFTARTLQYIAYNDEDQGGKYINSPQTPVYNKSSVLYGFDKAKQEIRRLDYAIVVEGNMDVIMSHQAGIKNSIAVSGTALTAEQLRLLKRYTSNLILSFDADTAGSQAVYRGITLAWDHDFNIKVIELKDGKDPADSIQQNPENWKNAIRDAVGVVDFYFNEIFARIDLTRSDHKKQAAQKIASIISRLKSKVEQAHYVSLLAAKLAVTEDIIWSLVKTPSVEPPQKASVVEPQKKSTDTLSEHLISFIAQHLSFVAIVIDEVEPEMLSPRLHDLYKKIIIHYTKGQSPDFRQINSELSQAELRLWSELVFQGDRFYGPLNPKQQEQELQHLLKRIKYNFYTRKLKELTGAIKLAEKEKNEEMVTSLMHEYQGMSSKRSR